MLPKFPVPKCDFPPAPDAKTAVSNTLLLPEFGRLIYGTGWGARLLAYFEQTGQDDVTVLFLGDNGSPAPTIEPPWKPGHSKGTLYEGGINVPFCVRGPAVSEPGARVQALVHVVDLLPTVLELAGVNVATALPAGVDFDGRSFLPQLVDSDAPSAHEHVLSELFHSENGIPDQKAIRNDRYKLIQQDAGPQLFFDLLMDPHEESDLLEGRLSTEQQAALESLEAALQDLVGG